VRTSDSATRRFDREKFFPSDWKSGTEQFLSLFHRYGYIYKPLAGGSWLSADERWKLTDTEILKAVACAHPKFVLGCRSGKSSRFAVLDIDANSKYHNDRALKKILKALADAGLSRSSLYRSSYSDGWHLYIFFDEPISSIDLRNQLVSLLTLHDFEIAKGTLEVFPHPGQSSQGFGLRLPLQTGFAWLDKRSLEVDFERAELTATKALELFLDALDSDANSYSDFRKLRNYVQEVQAKRAAVAPAKPRGASNVVPLRRVKEPQEHEFNAFVEAVFDKLPPGINADSWYRGRLYHLNGLSAPSQRADAIFCVGHYLFYGDPSRELPPLGYGYEQEREWAIKEFLELHHNGQSKDINRGRADAVAQVERAAHWTPAHRQGVDAVKFTDSRPISWIRANENRKTDARKRIKESLDQLLQSGHQFSSEDLRKAAGCSRETLYKHEDLWKRLWKQQYEDIAEDFFATCTGEYNAVEGADSPKIQPPSAAQVEIMPPGRLAARQIVFEISRRSEREKKAKLKAAVESRNASEDRWRSNVTRLTEKQPVTLSIQEIRALLPVLYSYRSLAPYEEDLSSIQAYIQSLKDQLVELASSHEIAPIEVTGFH
jgi:hypothetical protein